MQLFTMHMHAHMHMFTRSAFSVVCPAVNR